MTSEPNRKHAPEGAYIIVPNTNLTIERGVEWINELRKRENRAWLWILRNRWNIGLVGKHLNVVYGDKTLERFSDELEMPITTIRECVQVIKKWNGDAELYEGFITTPRPNGKPIRWHHIQKVIHSNLDPRVLGPEALVDRILYIIEENNRSLEAVNDVARQLPSGIRQDTERQIEGVQQAYTQELVGFVKNGHTIIPDQPGEQLELFFRLHTPRQIPEKGNEVRAGTYTAALEKALHVLGYVLTPS